MLVTWIFQSLSPENSEKKHAEILKSSLAIWTKWATKTMKNKGLEFWPPKKQVMYHKKPSINVGFWSSWCVCNTIHWLHKQPWIQPAYAMELGMNTEKYLYGEVFFLQALVVYGYNNDSYCWWKKSCTSWYVVGPIYLRGFYTFARWCRISAINSITGFQTTKETQHNLVGIFSSPTLTLIE